ncbi:hypothetical protein J608_5622, partial [Acinetobacter baumannii 1288284]
MRLGRKGVIFGALAKNEYLLLHNQFVHSIRL